LPDLFSLVSLSFLLLKFSIVSILTGAGALVKTLSSRYDRQVDRWHDLLERLVNLFSAELRRRAAGYRLQPVHALVLHYLSRCNRYSNTPAAVGEYLGLTRGTVSQSLLLLERRGMLTRLRDTADRRVVRLALSAAGAHAAAALVPPPAVAAAAAPEGLAERLETLLRELQHAHGGRSFGVCASCRHLRRRREAIHCGLTGEPLEEGETASLCREHEAAAGG
jgi:DNA-binding MarR family transcriptional regulator